MRARLRARVNATLEAVEEAKEASPPAPVAQDAGGFSVVPCGKVCDHDSPCTLPADHLPPSRHETEHGCTFYDDDGAVARCNFCGEMIEGNAAIQSHACAKEDPKPPEVEEPAIVQYMRERRKRRDTLGLVNIGGILDWNELDQLLAFIDSRKAAVTRDDLDRELAERVGRHALQIDQLVRDHIDEMTAAEQERDRLREELANRGPAQVSEWRAVAEQKQRNVEALQRELSALKAKPVVDVALRDIRERKLLAEAASETGSGEARAISRGRSSAFADAIAIFESLQPASAKADEKTMAGLSDESPARAVDGSVTSGHEEEAAESAEAGHPTPMPSADPARVGEEEQERRIARAIDALNSAAFHPQGSVEGRLRKLAEGELCLAEYLRAEREGRP